MSGLKRCDCQDFRMPADTSKLEEFALAVAEWGLAHGASITRTEETGDFSRVPAPFEQEISVSDRPQTVAEICERGA